MSDSGADRRRHPRYELYAQVRVKATKTDLIAELSNISESGALVDMGSLDTPKWIDVGRVVEIYVVHPQTLDPIELEARIVRLHKSIESTMLAVEFVAGERSQLSAVRALVMHASSLPPVARRRPPPLPGS